MYYPCPSKVTKLIINQATSEQRNQRGCPCVAKVVVCTLTRCCRWKLLFVSVAAVVVRGSARVSCSCDRRLVVVESRECCACRCLWVPVLGPTDNSTHNTHVIRLLRGGGRRNKTHEHYYTTTATTETNNNFHRHHLVSVHTTTLATLGQPRWLR